MPAEYGRHNGKPSAAAAEITWETTAALLAHFYGWTDTEIQMMPIERFNQYAREIAPVLRLLNPGLREEERAQPAINGAAALKARGYRIPD